MSCIIPNLCIFNDGMMVFWIRGYEGIWMGWMEILYLIRLMNFEDLVFSSNGRYF